jgi:hypothetical protein
VTQLEAGEVGRVAMGVTTCSQSLTHRTLCRKVVFSLLVTHHDRHDALRRCSWIYMHRHNEVVLSALRDTSAVAYM